MTAKRKRCGHDDGLSTKIDWSPTGSTPVVSMAYYSTDSSDSSMLSLPTPSPVHSLSTETSCSNGEGTLAASYPFELSLPPRRADTSQSMETPPMRRSKRLKHSSDTSMQSSPSFSKQLRMVSQKLKRPRASEDTSENRTTLEESPPKRSRSTSVSDQHTPEKLSQTLRPSGSPARVSGSKVVACVKFTDSYKSDLCNVDKTLVCKGFWDSIEEAGRICLPRRSGKTYNLTQLLLFFSSSSEHARVKDIPDSFLLNGKHTAAEIEEMDMMAKCRLKRECLFSGSLLQTMHPTFCSEHFMKYPVVHINLSTCKGDSLGDFIINLCGAIATVIEKLVDEARQNVVDHGRTPFGLDKLEHLHKIYEEASHGPDETGLKYKNLALRLFESLSSYVSRNYGRYILLIDEYDIPFISIRLSEWSKEDTTAAWRILKLLFQRMLKDNDDLLKGLLVGVFEIPLTETGSGANNVKDIRLVPVEENDIQSSVLTAAFPHSGNGLDALTDSFWFNASEVSLMLDNSTSLCAKIAEHKDYIMQTIRKWYNGYFIGRFRGKYNPWSVSSFIESLCDLLIRSGDDPDKVRGLVKSAARPYWVTTGTTGLIDACIDRHRLQFIPLAKRLIRSYENAKEHPATMGKRRRSSHVPLVSTHVNLAAFDSDTFSEPGLLTLCLYAGYLTRRQSTSVCIPNREVYQVWVQLFARAAMGAELADNSTNCARGALLKELWRGKTDLLCTLATSSHGVLSNHNKYLEHDYANHVANTTMAVSRFGGMLTHPWQKTAKLSDIVPIRENHAGAGHCDYTMRLYSTDNHANQLGVVIEFKLITNDRRSDTAHHKKRAKEGLDQIASKNYDGLPHRVS